MSFQQEIREKFKAIDIKQYAKELHGGAQYAPWSIVWDLLQSHYPETQWPEFKEVCEQEGEGQTCMVYCTLTIRETPEEGDTREAVNTMYLPVMESYGQFKPIVNPSIRDISDTRMRCFVKCAGIFGLGLEMWSGEDYDKSNKDLERILAFAKKKSDYRMDLWRTAIVIKDAFVEEDGSTAAEAWLERTEDEKKDLWLAETKGGFFTMKEKDWLRAAALEAMQGPRETA